MEPQPDLPSIVEGARIYGNADLRDPEVVVVSLLMFGPDVKAPGLEDARRWRDHFGLDERPDHVLLLGHPKLFGEGTRSMVPGFQLIDRNFVMTHDAAGNVSRDDLWTDLLPALGRELSR